MSLKRTGEILGEPLMDLYAVSDQVRALLQQRGRLAYRMLTLQFQLEEKQLEAIKEELIDIQEVAADKDGKMLVWTGALVPQIGRPISWGEDSGKL